jgi:hypothetical protein
MPSAYEQVKSKKRKGKSGKKRGRGRGPKEQGHREYGKREK